MISLNFQNLQHFFLSCCSRNGLKESKTVVCLNIFWFIERTMFVLYIFILSVTLWALLNIYKSRFIYSENPPNSTEYITSSSHVFTNTESTNPQKNPLRIYDFFPPNFSCLFKGVHSILFLFE